MLAISTRKTRQNDDHHARTSTKKSSDVLLRLLTTAHFCCELINRSKTPNIPDLIMPHKGVLSWGLCLLSTSMAFF